MLTVLLCVYGLIALNSAFVMFRERWHANPARMLALSLLSPVLIALLLLYLIVCGLVLAALSLLAYWRQK